MIEEIKYKGQLLAILVPDEYREKGISFFTEGDLSQQLAHMSHPAGKVIEPHVHNPVTREVHYTQEVLFIKSGKIRVDFYTDDQEYLDSRILKGGDVLLLATGGHGFEILEEAVFFEVKQGPYAGDQDKTRFSGVESSKIQIKNN